MQRAEKWRSLKVKDSKYEALAECSEKTGRPIIQLADEALSQFIKQVLPIYNAYADQARASIARRVNPAGPRRKKGPKSEPTRTQMDPVETVTIRV